MTEPLDLMKRAREALLSKKASDVIVFDVRRTSPVTDYYIIASGATGAQLKAMVSAVTVEVKKTGDTAPRCSGTPDDGWMVIDLFDVVIHVFQDEMRRYYSIEELWNDCPRVK